MSATMICIARNRRALFLFVGACLGWMLAICAGHAAQSPTESEPPSAPWSPPGSSSPVVEDELPAPTNADDRDLGSPWLLPEEEPCDEDGWYRPTYWFGPSPWDTGIELGINGSSGSKDSFSMRTGSYVKRESRFSKLDMSAYYNRTSTAGLITQDNATLDFRNDWLLDDGSPWTLFAKANAFYDQFQAFDVQSNANSGVGYQLLNRPTLNLIGRVGAGASREFGGPDNEVIPEALFGFEYDQHFTPTQKLYWKFDYYPEFADFNNYRMVTDAGWEIELVQPSNVSLKLSATDRYDSTPNGAEPGLINYSVLLLIKL